MKIKTSRLTRRLILILILTMFASIPTLPVHADSIFLGQQQVAPTVDTNSAGMAEAFIVTASASGTITSLSAYVDASSNANSLIIGLYSDNSGTPGSLLTQGTLTSPVAGTWNTVSVPNANVAAGSVYWIAILGPSGSGIPAFRDIDGGSRSETSEQGNLTTLPSTWSTGQVWNSSPVSAYAYGSTTSTQLIVSISPSAAIIQVNSTQQFTATVVGSSNQAVVWTTDGGSISTTGLYTAPSSVGTYHVTATSTVDNTTAATATVSVMAAPPPPANQLIVSISPSAAIIQVNLTQQFTATVTGSSNQAVVWTTDGGSISTTGLYAAPSIAGTYHVTATSTVDNITAATATVSVMVAATSPTPVTIFYDDFSGTSLSSAWTVISRHGEYAQNETECNIPQQVNVANSTLTITTALNAAENTQNAVVCGDFNPDGTVWNAPSWWPYITGDIQWANFNFTYGTVEIRARFPDSRSATWPATWLLGSNCQATNPYTGNTGVGTCPNIGQAGYTEIDMTECYNATSPWCQFHVANPSFGLGRGCDAVYPTADTNWHVYRTVWTASNISQYMDGVLVSTCNQRLSNPMFLIIQTQTGGVSGTPNSTYLPATLSIDYVKVTQP
jgi:beta-glucanase (GH16 family)